MLNFHLLENKLNKRYKINNERNFLFSIIIPIYNVEDYLEETINSILNQTLNFEKHVQIILVNDGSPDNSEEICLRYQKKYPTNIIYVKKENGGVSSARNEGIKYAAGEYINFLDSDDLLEKDALEKVYQFFSSHHNEIDVVCLPIYYFEARNGEHLLNDKFQEAQLIDIEQSPTKIQLHVSSAFVTIEQAKRHIFDENLKYGEDAKYINEIILEKGKYGVLTNTKYFYRIRRTQTSAIQRSHTSKSWYNESINNFSKGLINMALDLWGYVPKYVQHIIMYDLQWKMKIREIPSSILSEDEKQEFICLVQEVLQYIDDDVIYKQKFIGFHLKLFAIKLKYLESNTELIGCLNLKDNLKIFLNGQMINSLKDQQVYLNLVEIEHNQIFIEGMFASAFDESDCEISIVYNGKEIKTEKVERPLNDIKVWGITVKKVYGFKVTVDTSGLMKKGQIEFFVKVYNVKVNVNYKLNKLVPFSKKIPSYYAKDELILYPGKRNITVIRNSIFNHVKKEVGMIKRLIRLWKKKSGAKKAIAVRVIYHLSKVFKTRPIYLFMDRVDKADDNAEVLFRYAVRQNDGIKKYFIVSDTSEDYERMKKYGKVVSYGSYRHKLLLLLSDRLISSHADEVIVNPFQSTRIYYKDLLTFDYVFLQHGVTQNNLSGWLNKYQKNIKLFVTTAYKEYDSIINGSYGYTEKEVKCIGFPRYDRLINEEKNQILIMPTWRKNIASKLDHNLKRVYNDAFKKTEYFHMYNSLINNDELIEKINQLGYKIKFVIHPALKEQIVDFKASKGVEIVNPDTITYYKLFNESSLMITDYSSVAFDFAYLRKPVIYFQFDQEEFHRTHFSRGYFNYEEIGFGPVVKTLDEMIKELLVALENNCKLSEIYRSRIDDFFVNADQNNSKRVYHEIKKLDETR